MEEEDISYLISTFKFMTKHFKIQQKLFEDIYNIAYIHYDKDFIKLLDQYKQENDLKINIDRLLNKKVQKKQQTIDSLNMNQKLADFLYSGNMKYNNGDNGNSNNVNKIDIREPVTEQEMSKIEKVIPIMVKLDKGLLSQDEIIELTENQLQKLLYESSESEDTDQP